MNSPSNFERSQSLSNLNDEYNRIARKNLTLKWISLSLVTITVLSIILVGTIIWFFTYRSPKAQNRVEFQPVSPNKANV